MIAPLRESNTVVPEQHRLSEARQYLAAALLERPVENQGAPVAPWKAWTLVGWMVVAVAFWGLSMLGLW